MHADTADPVPHRGSITTVAAVLMGAHRHPTRWRASCSCGWDGDWTTEGEAEASRALACHLAASPRRDAWGVEHDPTAPSAEPPDFTRPYDALQRYCRATGATLHGREDAPRLVLELRLPTGLRLAVAGASAAEVAWRIAVHLYCCGPEAPARQACVCLWPGGIAIPDII